MKRFFTSLALALALTAAPALAAPIYIDGQHTGLDTVVQGGTTYVGLRQFVSHLRPDAAVTWEDGQAAVRAVGLTVTAVPGDLHIEANDRALYAAAGVRLEPGRTWVPVRALSAALDAEVDWDAATGRVYVTTGSGAIQSGDAFYVPDAVYWLSRIISAESRGEPMAGKIAVGNVVMNRVDHADFPDTIYGVIFDDRWGGQFEPVRNGTIYLEPTEESVTAAKLVLEGADVGLHSLYFLAPTLTDDHWIMEEREHVVTIGLHWFYA